MLYCLIGHEHVYEVQTVCQAFYPNQRFTPATITDISSEGCPMAVVSEMCVDVCRASLFENGRLLSENEQQVPGAADAAGRRKAVKLAVYRAFLTHTGFKPPWGSFTGIRPSKILHEQWKAGMSDAQTAAYMRDTYDMDEDKIGLCFDVARAERAVLSKGEESDYALYAAIPFCPTRCMYCSFTSYPVERYKDSIDSYLACILKELAYVAPFGDGRRLESVYIGGGTPTALDARQLDRLLCGIREHFGVEGLLEFTVEAGRPDTITREKLAVMKEHGVTRVSINPQTMNDATLERIGRAHTVRQFLEAYDMAKNIGFENINVDLIVGLPGEDAEDVAKTMERVAVLAPENLTVHTLAVKRASRLHEALTENGDMSLPGLSAAGAMMDAARRGARDMGMRPYCMYRQKNMVGHCENVGYCKPGFESVYNVRILVERQTILAAGAGAVTKLFHPETNRLERIFNVKNVDEYMSRIDEMLERKRILKEKR